MDPLLTGISVLIIGASQFAHNGYLITTLQDDLQQRGATVATYGACASMPSWWLTSHVVPCGTAVRAGPGPVVENKSPSATSWAVSDLIRQHHPQLVIIGIADTMAGYKHAELSVDWVKKETHDLAQAIASEHVACVWLGTTWGSEGGTFGKNYARVKELSDLMAQSVAPCDYVDSLAFSKPGEWPTVDGQHHTHPAYELWGRAAGAAIIQTSAVKGLHPPGG